MQSPHPTPRLSGRSHSERPKTDRQPKIDDAVTALLRSAERFPLLGREREHELAVRFRATGDRQARELLINSNLRFVAKVAARYRSYRLDMADVLQAGCVGLISAVDRYDPEQGVRLLSYAVWRIKSEIQEYILKNWALVRVLPSGAQRKLLFGRAEGRQGGAAKVTRWQKTATKARFYKELNAPMNDCNLTVEQTLADNQLNACDKVIELERYRTLHDGIAALRSSMTAQQKLVLRKRMLAEQPATLRELGDELGVSCERIRQVELHVRRKLQQQLRGAA